MKIFIIGTDFNSQLTAGFIKAQTPGHDVFLTAYDDVYTGEYRHVNISQTDIAKLKEFALKEGIELTVCFSPEAINAGITEEFARENLVVFAPYSDSACAFYNNALAKKIMYKLKIPTPRFGIFDKENVAAEYIRNAHYPIIIKSDSSIPATEEVFCKSFSEAKIEIQKVFEEPGRKAVIENTSEDEFYNMYFITDGYNAYPLISVKKEEFGGYTTLSAPVEKVPETMTHKILRNAIYPLLDDITKFSAPYVGIFGLKVQIKNDNFFVSELYSCFQDYDLQMFLSLIDENAVKLLYHCAAGELDKTGDYVEMKDSVAFSLITESKNLNIEEISDCDFFTSEYDGKLIITATAANLTSAKNIMINEIYPYLNEEFAKKIEKEILPEEIRI